jgi:hypothetical protein
VTTLNNFPQLKSLSSAIVLALLLMFAPSLAAKGHRSGSGHHSGGGHHSSGGRTFSTLSSNSGLSTHSSSGTRRDKCESCTRDKNGKIKRSEEAKRQFERQNPCPSTGKTGGSCPGYIVDHRKALAEGGADEPSNMQWQTTADAKAKDKWERKP